MLVGKRKQKKKIKIKIRGRQKMERQANVACKQASGEGGGREGVVSTLPLLRASYISTSIRAIPRRLRATHSSARIAKIASDLKNSTGSKNSLKRIHTFLNDTR